MGSPVVSKRIEKKEQTRQRLLQAATEVIAEKGFAAASLMEIAERAELTTGAVYSNFRSKEALLQAVVADRHERVAGSPARPSADLVAEARHAARMVDKPEVNDLLRAQVELYLLALRAPEMRAQMRDEEQAFIRDLAASLATVEAPPEGGKQPTLDQLAELFYATLQGLQQHRLLFPDAVPVSVFEWWARTIQRAAFEINRRGAD